MSGDDAASRLTKANRVSIRAVLVPIGEDVGKALVEHGILDPVSLPFAFADETQAPSGGSLTPDVIATLELDDIASAAPAPGESQLASGLSKFPEKGGSSASRPGSSGAKPLAPVRKLPY